jgi:hypothetical protein
MPSATLSDQYRDLPLQGNATEVEDVRSMHIDGYALALLLGIGVLSYLLGYLCSQMQFPEKLPQKKIRRRSK